MSTITEQELSNEQVALESEFSIGQARKIVGELFEPKEWVYWADFLGSWTIGVICSSMIRKFELFDWRQILCYFVSCILFYRCVLFIHELVHLRTTSFKAFRIVWNILCGIPFLIPSFMYYTHLDHHRRKLYGTSEDGEYIPLGQQSTWAILTYLTQPFWMPVLYVFRFMILTPLTWISSWVREKTFRHASSMIMEPKYVRPMPTKEVLRVWRLQEFGCFVCCWAVALALLSGLRFSINDPIYQKPIRAILEHGAVPITFLVQIYLTAIGILGANAIRTLGAHRFMGDGGEMTFVEQLQDSVNYPRWPIVNELWAPVGLRYHALHHLFPSLPYHNLDRAHAKLMKELPADSVYRQVNAESLFGVLRQLWSSARNAATERKNVTTESMS